MNEYELEVYPSIDKTHWLVCAYDGRQRCNMHRTKEKSGAMHYAKRYSEFFGWKIMEEE